DAVVCVTLWIAVMELLFRSIPLTCSTPEAASSATNVMTCPVRPEFSVMAWPAVSDGLLAGFRSLDGVVVERGGIFGCIRVALRKSALYWRRTDPCSWHRGRILEPRIKDDSALCGAQFRDRGLTLARTIFRAVLFTATSGRPASWAEEMEMTASPQVNATKPPQVRRCFGNGHLLFVSGR